jgi:murein DD-endopeptidase MepM/ murein hydrolase activator NlpD
MRKRVVIAAGLVFVPAVAPMVAQAEAAAPARSNGRVPTPPPPLTDEQQPANDAPPTAAPTGDTPPPPTAESTTPVPEPPRAPSSTDGAAPTTGSPASDTTTTTGTTPAAPDVIAPTAPGDPAATTATPTAVPTSTAVAQTAPATTTTAPPDASNVPSTTTPAPDPGTDITLVPVPTAAAGEQLAASVYDTVYANGLPLGTAMATSRFLESGNNYQARAAKASASGAYQIIDQFWNNYGGYPRAYLAPPAVQDQFAYEQFVEILKRNGNNLAAIPVAWYYPAALRNPALMDVVPMPEAGNRLTISEYQTKWLAKFFELLEQGSPPFLPTDTDPLIPSIAFPVLGPVEFSHDFGDPRGEHGERRHEGLDVIGTSGQPLRAAFDGVVTRIKTTDTSISGVVITITRGDGVRSNYFHVNDDTPGTRDNAAPQTLRIHPSLRVGDSVKAGQIVGYMGNSGNNPYVSHLHFELRTPEGVPIDPYPAVLAAQQREQCSVGIGPWSTDFFSPTEETKFHLDFARLPAQDQAALVAMAASTPIPAVHLIAIGPDGARWEIDEAGRVRAVGVGAVIQPGSGDCEVLPALDVVYGTGAAGVGRDLLPPDWWNVGVAYSGVVVDNDLEGGDGDASIDWATAVPPTPPPVVGVAAAD